MFISPYWKYPLMNDVWSTLCYTYIYTHVYVCETALQCHPQYSADVQFGKLSQIHTILTKLHQLP